MEFKMVEFSEEVKSFLFSYTPEDECITSLSEIKQIREVLDLESCKSVDDFTAIRNTVVKYYKDLKDKYVEYDGAGNHYFKDIDRYFRLSNSMMSVTAVIDHYIYAKFNTL